MIRKLTSIALIATAACIGLAELSAQDAAKAAKKKGGPPLPGAGSGGNSPHAVISTGYGGSRSSGSLVMLSYGRPFAKHPRTGEVRKVWGGLVPWDKAWRLGADEATTLITAAPLEIGGTTIPAGAYTLYMVPSENGSSKLAFSKNIGKWGVPVDEKSDVARVDLKKQTLDTPVDQLTITLDAVPAGSTNGALRIAWDNAEYSVPFTVKR